MASLILNAAVSPPGLVDSGSFSVLLLWASQFTCLHLAICLLTGPACTTCLISKCWGQSPRPVHTRQALFQLSPPCMCSVWGCPVTCKLPHRIPGLCLLQANSILLLSLSCRRHCLYSSGSREHFPQPRALGFMQSPGQRPTCGMGRHPVGCLLLAGSL